MGCPVQQIGARMDALDTEMTTIVRELREAISERARAAADVTPDVPLSMGSLHEATTTVFDVLDRDQKDDAAATGAKLQRPPLPISRKVSHGSTRLITNPHASPPQQERLFTPSHRRAAVADRVDTSLESKEAPRPGSASRRLFRTGSARITPTNSPRSIPSSPRLPIMTSTTGATRSAFFGSSGGARGAPESSPPGRGPVQVTNVEDVDGDDSGGEGAAAAAP